MAQDKPLIENKEFTDRFTAGSKMFWGPFWAGFINDVLEPFREVLWGQLLERWLNRTPTKQKTKGESKLADMLLTQPPSDVLSKWMKDVENPLWWDQSTNLMDRLIDKNVYLGMNGVMDFRYTSPFWNKQRSDLGNEIESIRKADLPAIKLPGNELNALYAVEYTSDPTAIKYRYALKKAITDHLTEAITQNENVKLAMSKYRKILAEEGMEGNIIEGFLNSTTAMLGVIGGRHTRAAGGNGAVREAYVKAIFHPNSPIYGDLQKAGQYLGMEDYYKDPSKSYLYPPNFDRMLQQITSGVFIDFDVKGGKVERYDYTKAQSFESKFGFDNSVYGIKDAVDSHHNLVKNFLEGKWSDPVEFSQALDEAFFGKYLGAGAGGIMRGKTEPSLMQIAYSNVLNGSPKFIKDSFGNMVVNNMANNEKGLRSVGVQPLSEGCVHWMAQDMENYACIYRDKVLAEMKSNGVPKTLIDAKKKELDNLKLKLFQQTNNVRQVRRKEEEHMIFTTDSFNKTEIPQTIWIPYGTQSIHPKFNMKNMKNPDGSYSKEFMESMGAILNTLLDKWGLTDSRSMERIRETEMSGLKLNGKPVKWGELLDRVGDETGIAKAFGFLAEQRRLHPNYVDWVGESKEAIDFLRKGMMLIMGSQLGEDLADEAPREVSKDLNKIVKHNRGKSKLNQMVIK